MHHKYRVKTYNWIKGILKTVTHVFESKTDADRFVNTSRIHKAKVYDEKNQMIRSVEFSDSGIVKDEDKGIYC